MQFGGWGTDQLRRQKIPGANTPGSLIAGMEPALNQF